MMNTNTIVFIAVFVVSAVSSVEESCYKDVENACTSKSVMVKNCTAVYGGYKHLDGSLQKLANLHLKRSFDFLLMSTHYANYEKNRVGFEKLYRELSDTTWSDAFDIIKYITLRGGSMNFGNTDSSGPTNLELYELQSIAKALDIEKEIAQQTYDIHSKASRESVDHHDPGVATYLQEKFVERHTETVRKLSGYATDLKSLLAEPDSSLSLFLFDDYLQKQ